MGEVARTCQSISIRKKGADDDEEISMLSEHPRFWSLVFQSISIRKSNQRRRTKYDPKMWTTDKQASFVVKTKENAEACIYE